jgi:hypothetical protein
MKDKLLNATEMAGMTKCNMPDIFSRLGIIRTTGFSYALNLMVVNANWPHATLFTANKQFIHYYTACPLSFSLLLP